MPRCNAFTLKSRLGLVLLCPTAPRPSCESTEFQTTFLPSRTTICRLHLAWHTVRSHPLAKKPLRGKVRVPVGGKSTLWRGRLPSFGGAMHPLARATSSLSLSLAATHKEGALLPLPPVTSVAGSWRIGGGAAHFWEPPQKPKFLSRGAMQTPPS